MSERDRFMQLFAAVMQENHSLYFEFCQQLGMTEQPPSELPFKVILVKADRARAFYNMFAELCEDLNAGPPETRPGSIRLIMCCPVCGKQDCSYATFSWRQARKAGNPVW